MNHPLDLNINASGEVHLGHFYIESPEDTINLSTAHKTLVARTLRLQTRNTADRRIYLANGQFSVECEFRAPIANTGAWTAIYGLVGYLRPEIHHMDDFDQTLHISVEIKVPVTEPDEEVIKAFDDLLTIVQSPIYADHGVSVL